jgi:hypothetical protein
MRKKKVLKTRRVHKLKKKYIKRKMSNKKHRKQIHRNYYKKQITKVIAPAEIPEIVLINNHHTCIPEKKIIIKRSRKGKEISADKMYFTKDTEDAVILYNKTEDFTTREQIYETRIKYPFEKLVENVFNTFKFSYFETTPLDAQKETISHLVSNMHKYDPKKGKAFGYFSVVAKRYLIQLNNTIYKNRNRHAEIGEEHDENTIQLQTEDKYYKNSEMKEFISLMISFWENNINKIFNKQRDLDIANAIIELFRNNNRIETWNKKALYLMIREISNCKTQQITKIINKMKQYQSAIYKSYINDGCFEVKKYINI